MSRISKPASRVLALLMVVCMLIGMLPVSAFAAEGETMPITTVVEDGHDHDHDHEAIDDEQENIEDEEPVIEDEEPVIDEEELVIELESIEDQQEAVEAEVTPRAGEQIVEITTNTDKNSATEDVSIAIGESFILKLKNGSRSEKRHAINNTDSSVASVDANNNFSIDGNKTKNITISGLKSGKTTITFTGTSSKGSKYYAVVNVTVGEGASEDSNQNSVSITATDGEGGSGTASIKVGETLIVKITNNSSYNEKTFSGVSANSAVATVEGGSKQISAGATGEFKVTGVANGTTTITFTGTGSGSAYYATLTLTVGEGGGTVTPPTDGNVYTLVNSVTSGKDYLIVSESSGRAYALKNPGGSSGGASMGATAVTIESGKIKTDATDIVWTATANGEGFNLTNDGDYLEGKSGNVKIWSSQNYPDRHWEYDDNQLTQGGGQNTYTVYYSNGFTSTTDSTNSKVYFFEEAGSGDEPVNPPVDPDPGVTPTDDVYMAFTSDIHNNGSATSNGTGANNLTKWLEAVSEKIGDTFDTMGFCGDNGDRGSNGDTYWSRVQTVMDVVSGSVYVDAEEGFFVDGNHEYINGSQTKNHTNSNATSKKIKLIGDKLVDNDYILYSFGASGSSESSGFVDNDITALDNYLKTVDSTKPVFVLSHFPIHYYSSRTTSNAQALVNVLNMYPNVIFLWGHNHTLSDSYYDEVYMAGSQLPLTSSNNSKVTINFTYAGAGCMADSSTAAGVQADGLVAKVDGNKVTLTYYGLNGSVVGQPATVELESAAHGHTDVDNDWETDGTYHWHTCICGAEFDKAAHSGGTATCVDKKECTFCSVEYGDVDAENHVGETEIRNAKAATCGEPGYTGDTYCKSCNTKIEDGEAIAATGAHVDADGDWETDGTDHWHTCGCGAEFDKAAHSGGTATCVDKKECTFCSAEYGDVDAENHVGETEIRNAKAATCGEPGYTGDTYCKSCNTKIEDGEAIAATGAHVDADGDWETNGTDHWHTCGCGAEFEKAAHSGGTATCVDKKECTVCKAAYGDKDAANHVGGTEIRDDKAATCGEPGYTGDTYCKSCDTKIETGTTIEATGDHVDADGKWETDDTYHWHTCGCGAEFDKAAHSGGTATCVDKKECTVCSAEYGDVDAANHVGGTEIRDDKAATCGEPGYTGDTYCKSCDTKIETGTVIEATGAHVDADGDWETDDTYHWHTCGCGAEFDKAAHSGGTATCVDKKECTVCSAEYGDVDAANHVGGTEIRDDKAATCGEPGYTGDTYCKSCDTKIETGTVIEATGDHVDADGKWEINDTDHWHTCGCSAEFEKAAHSGGTATCVDKKECTICEAAYGDKDAANHVGGTEIRNAKEATCSEAGYTGDTYCKSCDTKIADGEEIEATGNHNLKTVAAEAATCVADGHKAYWSCQTEGCGKHFSDEAGTAEIENLTNWLADDSANGGKINKLGHTYGEVNVAWAADSKTATVSVTCDNCAANTEGKTLTETVTATAVSSTAGTCQEEGTATYKVEGTIGGKTYSATNVVEGALGAHDLEAVAAEEATCVEDGHKEYWSCQTAGCGKIFLNEAGTAEIVNLSNWLADASTNGGKINKLGHTYGEADIVWAEDLKTATVTVTCDVCEAGTEDKSLSDEVDATVTNTEGDCKTESTTTYAISGTLGGVSYADEKTVTGEKDPAKHAGETDIRNAVEPTCSEPGYTGDTYCKSCDTKLADGEAIEATGEHTYENGACTECGEEEPYLVSISVTTDPTVMVYVEGDSFNPAGMVVTATYSNGKTKEVTGYAITGGTSMALGTNYITISYKEGDVTAVATLAVSVVNAQTVLSIDVTTNPVKMIYTEGESFDPTGMVVTATYANGSRPVSGYTTVNDTNMPVGQQTITISYAEGGATVTTTLEVTVKAALTGITVNTENAKMEYADGEAFDPTGLVVTAAYADGTMADVTEYTVEGGEDMQVGENIITIRYQERGVTKTQELVVTVYAVLTDITVNTEAVKLAYNHGETFDPTGLVVTAAYSDETTKVLDAEDYTITGGTDMVVGKNVITVSYTEHDVTISKEFEVTVTAVLKDITVNTEEVKLTYNYGEIFDPTGMVVTAAYSDETTKVLEADKYTIIGGIDMKTGENTITVSYTEGDVTVTKEIVVTVTTVLTGIEANTDAVKLEYIEGEKFDPTGLVVTAIYSDGTTKAITDYTIEGGENMVVGANTITIRYTDGDVTKTAILTVTVKTVHEPSVERVSGTSRVETALEVADAMKEALGVEKFDAVILANGEDKNFADALTGSYLATVKNAPILMYRTSGLSDSTKTFIQNNLKSGGTVYLLGGELAIPASVAAELSASYTVKRLAGGSRFDTNLAILEEAGVGDKEILIARGFEFADSLSASATGLPILMVNEVTGKLTDAQIEFLQKYKGNAMTILGGTIAVSEALEATIEEVVGKDVDRVYGTSREETSVEIAKRYFDAPEFAVIAYSRKCPDGLCGGPLAYAMGAPLLLVNAGQESHTNAYITANEITSGYVLGGTLVITDATARAVFGLAEDAVIEMK